MHKQHHDVPGSGSLVAQKICQSVGSGLQFSERKSIFDVANSNCVRALDGVERNRLGHAGGVWNPYGGTFELSFDLRNVDIDWAARPD